MVIKKIIAMSTDDYTVLPNVFLDKIDGLSKDETIVWLYMTIYFCGRFHIQKMSKDQIVNGTGVTYRLFYDIINGLINKGLITNTDGWYSIVLL